MKLVGGLWSKMRQKKELVSLIPNSDQSLKLSRTKLYKTLVVALCLLLLGLVILFFLLFPRSTDVSYVGIKSAYVSFDEDERRVYLNITSTLDISNKNFYPIYMTHVAAEVLFSNTVIGMAWFNSSTVIRLRGEQQVDYMVSTIIADDLSYLFAYCTLATIKIHNIAVAMRVVATTVSYLGYTEQHVQETYQYVDCGSNTTTHLASELNAFV